MAVITLPTTLKLGPGCSLGQRRFNLLASSDATGTTQARLQGPPRWTLSLVQPDKLTLPEAGAWTALVASLRGRVNVLAAWDPIRSAPMGTMRGSLTLASAAAAGDLGLSVTGSAGQAGTTLKAGDWLQVGNGLGTSQLVMLTADAVANGAGVIALAIEPPLRTAFIAGAAVTWDKALAYFRQQTDAFTWTYSNRGLMVTGLSMDLLEVWS